MWGIFHILVSVPHNTAMGLNNVMEMNLESLDKERISHSWSGWESPSGSWALELGERVVENLSREMDTILAIGRCGWMWMETLGCKNNPILLIDRRSQGTWIEQRPHLFRPDEISPLISDGWTWRCSCDPKISGWRLGQGPTKNIPSSGCPPDAHRWMLP
jgi:hypothetical protein